MTPELASAIAAELRDQKLTAAIAAVVKTEHTGHVARLVADRFELRVGPDNRTELAPKAGGTVAEALAQALGAPDMSPFLAVNKPHPIESQLGQAAQRMSGAAAGSAIGLKAH